MTSRNRRQRKWKKERQFRNKVTMMRHRYDVLECAMQEIHFHQTLERVKAQEWIFKRQKRGMEYVT